MIHQVFAIYDGAAGAYLNPFHMPREGMALRAFSDCANSKEHQFAQHPADYTLFHIGTFDDSTGEYHNLPHQKNLGTALSFIAKQNLADDTTIDRMRDAFTSNQGMQ